MGNRYHFLATHNLQTTTPDGSPIEVAVMAVQHDGEVWLYSEDEATEGVDEPRYVADVKELPRDGVIGEGGRFHRDGRPIRNACLKRLGAILDFVPIGTGLTARELDREIVFDDESGARSRPARKPKPVAHQRRHRELPDLQTADTLLPIASRVHDEDPVGHLTESARSAEIPNETPKRTPMTFVAAAILVLHRLGRPARLTELVEIIEREGLVDHVSKDPAGTLAARLLKYTAKGDVVRKVAPATYALVDWGVSSIEQRRGRKPTGSTIKLSLDEAKEALAWHDRAGYVTHDEACFAVDRPIRARLVDRLTDLLERSGSIVHEATS